jgi:gamma-resorcylate decarboxylase
MQGKIALEEHFALDDTLDDSRRFVPAGYWPELRQRLLDVQDGRIAQMDRHGIELMILSLNSPAVQAIHERNRAIEMATRANDFLAGEVAKRPDRFQGFAALPLQDVDAACIELERCVRQLGFRGALANGFSQIDDPENCVYLDDVRYRPFWALVATLDVPFYLHPRNPIASWSQIYRGAEWLLGPTWAFGHETAVHGLRLMGSGLFDTHPTLKIILGHMGEGIPFSLWRIDNRNAWVKTRPAYPALHSIRHYFERNVWLTVSGNFHTPTLVDAMTEIGSDRIMFSTDWPFENVDHAAGWFDTADISEGDRTKIGRTNALELFKL